jgi:mitochondrial-processing peptidase subunit alpha
MEAQRNAARYEIREISSKPDMILPEVLHNVAYGGKTLGNPLLCPEDRIDVMDESVLRVRMEDWYRPERMVIAGAGMQHEQLVELTDKYFASLKSVPSSTSQLSTPSTGSDSPSLYTGGQRHIFDASQEFNHLYVAFEGVGIHDEDIYTLATIQVLLGGGGSFSAGQFIRAHPVVNR